MPTLPLCACGCDYPVTNALFRFLKNHKYNNWQERFWNNIQKTDTCWFWHGPLVGPKPQYGSMTVNGKHQRAHRLSWELRYGPIPNGLLVCHHCDVRHCVNPEHLFLGTQTDNLKDCFRKGRSPMNKDLSKWRLKGEDNHKTTLKTQDILAIREKAQTHKVSVIAEEYHVTVQTIYNILKRKTWGHIP